jgi:hypothetical protein
MHHIPIITKNASGENSNKINVILSCSTKFWAFNLAELAARFEIKEIDVIKMKERIAYARNIK